MKTLIILAAGKGETLRPITETRPKPLARIMGRSLLCRHINSVSADEVIIVANYLKDMIVEEAERCANDPRTVRIVEQGRELGTGHAVVKALEEANGDILHIVYGDVFLSMESYRVINESEPNTVFG
ncbi:MAG: NTP transferase domain-containing protein, partial [Desulfurococcales archaeon]|nr:NTP transferase domain-containing protein [Desulfurococcales archaeon]